MTFESLNASNYGYNLDFYNAEFEELLSKIIKCYDLMIQEKTGLLNDENSIRDILLINYLKENKIRKEIGLTDYLFDREVPEDRTKGRTDIKIQTLNTFVDTRAYYVIECKRLDSVNPKGISGLNFKYIENGISRFISKIYSSHYKTNGMIAFVVSPLDIDNNIEIINEILTGTFKDLKTNQPLKKKSLLPEFNFSYNSIHEFEGNNIMIYHLMFNCSENI